MPAIFNHKRYPLTQLTSSTAAALITATRISLERNGSATLPQFVTAGALAQMTAEALSIAHLAFPGPSAVSPYFFNYQLGQDEILPATHPLKRKGKRNLAQVAADLIPPTHLLRQLYESRPMRAFLSAVLETPVYLNRDPYQSLNLSVMREGGCQQWHFDAGNMVTTLLLQQPEGGGVFEYAPMIRSDDAENFDIVEAVLDGRRDRVRQLELEAGTLSLFRGHYSLHRVTEVNGSRARLQAILGYSTQPDFYASKASSILHYGPRVAQIEAQRPRYPHATGRG